MTLFQVGVVRCDEAHLNPGENRDRKRTLSANGRAAMHHLVPPEPIPPNFVAEMDSKVRTEVMDQPTIQARVATLFKRLQYTPIPRGAVATVARTTGDPMRRVRADAYAEDSLQGMRIFSARYGKPVLAALGQEPLEPDHFMSVPEKDIQALPRATRDDLGLD